MSFFTIHTHNFFKKTGEKFSDVGDDGPKKNYLHLRNIAEISEPHFCRIIELMKKTKRAVFYEKSKDGRGQDTGRSA